jgi:hypothetical protein
VRRVVEENGRPRTGGSLEHRGSIPLRTSQQNGTISNDDLQININNLDA